MSILYIVAGPEYWASIHQTRQLTCGRVRIHVADDPKLTAVICTHLEAIRARLRQRRATV